MKLTWFLDQEPLEAHVTWGTDQSGYSGGLIQAPLWVPLCIGDHYQGLECFLEHEDKVELYRVFADIEIAAERLLDTEQGPQMEYTWRHRDPTA